jgi:exosortase/archaeosortase family protein
VSPKLFKPDADPDQCRRVKRQPDQLSATRAAQRAWLGAAAYALRFLLLTLVLFSIYAFPYSEAGYSEAWFERYLGTYAQIAAWGLHWFESAITVNGATISGRVALTIVKSCDAMDVSLLFLAALLALPGASPRKCLAAIAGLLAIAGVNLVRIISLYFVLADHSSQFEFFHTELWPLLMLVVTGALFRWCARFVQVDFGKQALQVG